MEYAPCGDLATCVHGSLPEIESQSVCQQIGQALSIMHEKHFVPRDLSPAVSPRQCNSFCSLIGTEHLRRSESSRMVG